jgi:Tfp pilus assembly protein PilO
MNRTNDKKKIVFIAAGALLLCGAATGGVWWAQGLIEEEQNAIKGLQEQVAAAEAKIKKIPGVERDVIILRENVQEYVKILPEDKEVTNFVRATNQFSAQTGINLTKVQPVEFGVSNKGSAFGRYTYQFEFRATLWQFMKFISFFENYERFVRVASFNLTTGDTANGRMTAGEDGDVVHQMQMVVETYVYNAAGSGKDVVIPNYANKVASLQADILQARNQILSANYEFKGPRGRRDVFVDPRESSSQTAPGALPEELQKNIVEECKRDLNEIIGIHKRSRDANTTIIERYRLEKVRNDKMTQLISKVDETINRGRVSSIVLKVRWTKEVVEPLFELKRQVEGAAQGAVSGDRYLAEKDMKELITLMKTDLEQGNLEAARQRYEDVQDRVKVPQDDPRYKLAYEVVRLAEKTRVALEFSTLKLNIQGVCVNQDGKSGLILNGTVYQEGDYIDPNLLVKAVAAEHVEFVFKGFTVVKTW